MVVPAEQMAITRMSRLLAAALAVGSAHALPNGLGQLPGLGWNSDYCTNCTGPASAIPLSARLGGGLRGFGGEHFIKHIADHMHTVKYPTSTAPQTLQELGFRYVNMVSRTPPECASSRAQLDHRLTPLVDCLWLDPPR